MKPIRLCILAALALLVFQGCNRKPPAPKLTRISSTKAFERYFGPAPTTDKGSCFAFVIYFPSAREPGAVVPFPFFSFDEGSLRRLAVQRFLSGMEVGSYRGEFLPPLPAGTHLLSIDEKKGVVTLDFSNELASGADRSAVTASLQALGLTLRQFAGVSRLRILVEGNDAKLGAAANRADEKVVRAPGPPRLLSVSASKEKGAAVVEEVSAFFDRPVDVAELKLLSPAGAPFAGELYHAVFDMAGVLKPKEPAQFKPGLPVRVRWKVTDKLGRKAEGESVWPLQVVEH